MATKTIAWNTGGGNITLTYTGQGNGSISVKSDENDSFDERSQRFNIVTTKGTPEKALSILVKQAGKTYPVGTVFDFDYTGSVQQVTLPKGKYKLQCWGAQGGTSYGSSNGVGSKGGYSEGVLTLTETKTLYIFVGGQGSRGSSTSLVNGGWNGGGASVGRSSYNSGGTNGYSYPACGGGATDISTVSSDMSYSNGRTNRSSASLLARCIVAGGGAGGSYRYTSTTTTETSETNVSSGSLSLLSSNEITVSSKTYTPTKASYRSGIGAILRAGVTYRVEFSWSFGYRLAHLRAHTSTSGTYTDALANDIYTYSGSKVVEYTPTVDVNTWYIECASDFVYSEDSTITINVYADEREHLGYSTYYKSLGTLLPNTTYRLSMSGSSYNSLAVEYYTSSGSYVGEYSSLSFTTGSSSYTYRIRVQSPSPSYSYSYTLYKTESVTSTSTSSGYSNQSQQGGGTSGRGSYPGTQSSAGSGGASFGLGANQATTNYRYAAGGGGGGWYGGGTGYSDTSTSYVNYSGGGSGFVNISTNASYRPSGYTGLQLDSGTTTAGNTSHPSTSGGTETGHSGNGYARITVIE